MALLAVLAIGATAQPMIGVNSGLVSYSDGDVYLNGKAIGSEVARWPQMHKDDLLSSGAGRVEVLLGPCVVLHLDQNSSLRMIRTRLVDARVELVSGAAFVHDDSKTKNGKVTVLLGGSTVPLRHPGLYRFDALPARLSVLDGKAVVMVGKRMLTVGPGRMLPMDGAARAVEKFHPHSTNGLEWWSERRMIALARTSGLSGRQAEQREENEAAASRAASMQAEIHNPNSIYFDPQAPNPPTPVAGPGKMSPERPRMCM